MCPLILIDRQLPNIKYLKAFILFVATNQIWKNNATMPVQDAFNALGVFLYASKLVFSYIAIMIRGSLG